MDDPTHPAPGAHARSSGDAEVEDLKATEDSIRSDLRRLTDVEERKSRLDPADPRVDTLSDEAVELAEAIHRKTRAERQLSEDVG
jgi:hypothetical protein